MIAAGKSQPTRRSYLRSLTAVTVPAWLSGYRWLSAANHDKVKIADIKIMTPQGSRTYTPVRVDTGADVHGFAESYGSPGLGVKEEIHRLKERSVGNDPLQIDRLYTEYRYADGSAHAQQRAMSGIEMALWDLASKLLDGKFRDMVRLYDHSHPDDSFDKAVLRDWAQQVKGSPLGINMHKSGPPCGTGRASIPVAIPPFACSRATSCGGCARGSRTAGRRSASSTTS